MHLPGSCSRFLKVVLALFGSTCGSSSRSSVDGVGGEEECVDASGILRQHHALPEGRDCDAVWLVFISLVQASWLKDGGKASGGQCSVHNVTDSHLAGQVPGFLWKDRAW